MKKGVCYIVGAGECYGLDFIPNTADCVIAADGGLAHLNQNGLTADMIIGDFDSLQQPPVHPSVIRLNKEKDDTDTFAAVRQGIDKGYRLFHLYGCTGGRLDHTIANIQLLAYLADSSMRGFLFDKDAVVTAVTDGKISFGQYDKGYVSVFSVAEKSTGVYLRGLKYELADAALTNTFALGISNEFTGGESSISVEKGTLLVTFPKRAIEKIRNFD